MSYPTVDAMPDYLRSVLPELEDKRSGLLCPSCSGGASHERSLSMYRIWPHIVLKCYRAAKCGFTARIPYADGEPTATHLPPANHFRGETCRPGKQLRRYLRDRYGIEYEAVERFRLRQVVDMKAVYLPVFGPNGETRGGVVRRFDGWDRKAQSYKTKLGPWMAWYDHAVPDRVPLVVVEDQLSAIRCWQLGYNAVSLLGTQLSAEKVAELSKYNRYEQPVTLALDGDVWNTACDYARRYAFISDVKLLHEDLKDISDSEIGAVLNG